MKSKIICLLVALNLLPSFMHARQNYRVEPSPWTFSGGAGLGTMVPSSNLANSSRAGFAAIPVTRGQEILTPVPFNEVTLEDDFWLPRLHTQK